MKPLISIVFTTVVALVAASASLAAQSQAPAPAQVASPAAWPTGAPNKSQVKTKPQAAAKIKLIDINSAKKEELKTLPGITDAEAAKIVANRPYGSKAWLASDNILTQEKYLTISKLVIAKQPYKDAAKNAALYRNKK
ncbi:MAG: helix-hairpin-helix domain-containing protein [Rhodoferax sp.]|uniref:ComEA family DNA-binding protein n=1 Tax=Rhodoferax sp. TaxID=50421 RepID=UPI0013FE906A|nr:helix-hairpin-helix domain-containing protein [Rhodoferax sp.]NDP38539.1 helix-hairpin-helix domain-containing protein [Rhodoferax sp.]